MIVTVKRVDESFEVRPGAELDQTQVRTKLWFQFRSIKDDQGNTAPLTSTWGEADLAVVIWLPFEDHETFCQRCVDLFIDAITRVHALHPEHREASAQLEFLDRHLVVKLAPPSEPRTMLAIRCPKRPSTRPGYHVVNRTYLGLTIDGVLPYLLRKFRQE